MTSILLNIAFSTEKALSISNFRLFFGLYYLSEKILQALNCKISLVKNIISSISSYVNEISLKQHIAAVMINL
jgi:hypothetical protein